MDNVFTPESVTFDNFSAVIAAAKARNSGDKLLIIDMAKASDNFDSSAVCLLLNLIRDAHKNQRLLEIHNISGRFKKLLKLYQLEPLISTTPSDQTAS